MLPSYVMAQEPADTAPTLVSQTDTSGQKVISIEILNARFEELQERQKRIEVATFPLVDSMAQMRARLEESERRISILETRANGNPQTIPTGTPTVGTGPPIPTPPPENIVVVTSDGYTLRRTERGGLLWPPSKAAKVTFQLPAVDQCETAGVWLIDNAGVSRIKNAFFVRNHDDETKAIWICEKIDGKWQSAIAEFDRTAHVIELKNGGSE